MLKDADCEHCGDRLSRARQVSLKLDEVAFCCSGCETVYEILKEKGLSRDFYELRRGQRNTAEFSLKTRGAQKKDFSTLDLIPSRKMDFFIEGIHCTACVWILERLPELCPEVRSARLDMGQSILRVTRHEVGGFSKIADLLWHLGYPPHAIQSTADGKNRLQAQDSLTLKRIGVSAFSALNVMAYSFSLYWGVDGTLAVWFRVLSLLVALPALTYGAWPFYKNAYFALKSKRISMDLPISLALIGGLLESARQTVLGSNHLYLDSVTMLVTLLLLSRYFLSRLERTETSAAGILPAILPLSAGIQVGDEIALKAGDTVPADGVLISGNLELNEAFLTGESRPVDRFMFSPILAGSLVLDGLASMKVQKTGEETQLGKLSLEVDYLASVETVSSEKSDRWATIFIASVIGISFLMVLLFGREDLGEALRRSFALLIIACPCALALATPLALARGHRIASRAGILLRRPEILEKCSRPQFIVFDKTGTLTQGTPRVEGWKWHEDHEKNSPQIFSLIYSLEQSSSHPYATSLIEALENMPGVQLTPLKEVQEVIGQGIQGIDEAGHRYFLGRKFKTSPTIGFWMDETLVVDIEFSDQLRMESKSIVRTLEENGFSLAILSGDSPATVQTVAKALHISNFRGGLLPIEKAQAIEELKKKGQVIMLGDGVNDLAAIGKADIGIALNRTMGGAVDVALSQAPIIFLKPDLSLLLDWLDLGKRFQSTMRRNLFISFVYNLAGASLAVSGLIHPLVAAIAMPVSSLTVFISTALGINRRVT